MARERRERGKHEGERKGWLEVVERKEGESEGERKDGGRSWRERRQSLKNMRSGGRRDMDS